MRVCQGPYSTGFQGAYHPLAQAPLASEMLGLCKHLPQLGSPWQVISAQQVAILSLKEEGAVDEAIRKVGLGRF